MFGFEKHCPVCGTDVEKELGIKRFGKYFCSDNHAEVYAKKKMEKEILSDEESDRGGGGCC
ncbi:MAG: hypothetical protein ACRD4J_03365 [Nitrososphaeraceae archaeon]